MNIQAYISSGAIELYVHGLASPEEIREVEDLAAQHPEIQHEIDVIRQTLERYADIHGVKPPEGLKAKVMQRLDSNAPKTRTREKANHEVRTHQRPHRESESNSQLDSSKLLTWGLALALLAALAAIFIFWKQASQATQQSADLNTQFNEYKKSCEDRQKKDEALKDQFIAIRHWATKPVQMRGTPLSEDGYAVVYWNNVKKTAYLDVVKLPEPAAGKQYQLWAIVDGKPTDMGIFDLSTPDGSMKTVDFIESPQAFAVTLEPKGGSQSPTLDQMYVVGSVKG